jgi:hypothetical protein
MVRVRRARGSNQGFAAQTTELSGVKLIQSTTKPLMADATKKARRDRIGVFLS